MNIVAFAGWEAEIRLRGMPKGIFWLSAGCRFFLCHVVVVVAVVLFDLGAGDLPSPPPPDIGENACRFIRYHFGPEFLGIQTIGTTLEFTNGEHEVHDFRMIERHYFRDQLITSYDFTMPFVIPNTRNTWEMIYTKPEFSDEWKEALVTSPWEVRSDSFYFVNGRLIMHNRAAIGLAGEEFVASSLRKIHQEGISTQVRFGLENGSIRIVDVFDSLCGEIKEVKVGKVSCTKAVAEQIWKDVALRQEHGYKPSFHFFKSPKTGQGGPTKPLEEFLAARNMGTHVHDHTVAETNGACRACQKDLSAIAHANQPVTTHGVQQPSMSSTKGVPKPSVEVNSNPSIQTSVQMSQALWAAGFVNLAVALVALGVAKRCHAEVSKVEKELVPELRMKASDFLTALSSFESALQRVIDLHLDSSRCSCCSNVCDGLVCRGLTSVVCWALGWKDRNKLNEEMKKVEQHFKNLEERHDAFKKAADHVSQETEGRNFKAKIALALGLSSMAVGCGVAVAGAAIAASVAEGAAVAGLGVTSGSVGGVAAVIAAETMERCHRIFHEVEELLQNVEDGFLKVQGTYDAAWLKICYDYFEKELGIPNLVGRCSKHLSQCSIIEIAHVLACCRGLILTGVQLRQLNIPQSGNDLGMSQNVGDPSRIRICEDNPSIHFSQMCFETVRPHMPIGRLGRRGLFISRAVCTARARKPAMAEGKQSTARRDLLQQIEVDVQKKWEENKVFECDAPDSASEKFMCTFPYPYMNGLLHIGHAFSLTKAIFAAHFNRLLGKKVLFPFGFHCTGMPIQAAANKLSREFEVYGSPYPIFPPGRPTPKESQEGVIELDDEGVTMQWKAPPCSGKKAIKEYIAYVKVKDGEFKEVKRIPQPSAEVLKAGGNKVKAVLPVESGGCVYKVEALLEDGSKCPPSPISDEVSVDAAPKDKKSGAAGGKRVAKKILAKSGDAAFQYEILKAMGLSPEEIPKFVDPLFWLQYFPPLGVRDLKRFGCPVDFRRSFITTSANSFYDSFIRWQFRKLQKSEKIGFGKRPTIFSELDKQACMDHDRAEGEGVVPQEYTAIKIELLGSEWTSAMQKTLKKGSKVYLLAATLRAETMPGQTNCWILPTGQYGCFEAPENQVYVTSHRAARNMSFQGILMPWGKPKCLMEVSGQELVGKKVAAPTTKYKYVHILPLPTIKMDKGTGIVTSVPSDSPDDYAAYMDLMKSDKKREHFGVKKEWVDGFELIPIIDVEIDGEVRSMAAQYVCEKLGVQSINDRVKLAEAHDTCYKLGFDKGIMSLGPFKGQPVKKAKFEFRTVMIKDKQAFTYSEPEKKVVSRSGDECVVASIDQWYLKYGEESWRGQIEGHLQSSKFVSYNDRIKESFEDAIGWLKEWACSRSFGLGTQVPWDEQFVIESLSDSTIYMAYYTVGHLLHGEENLDGKKGSPEGIKAEDLTDEVWDFVFLNGPMPKKSKIPQKLMEKMRKEFRFWYPMDLRVSGKDLIQNHLTMALYNHACVWEKEPELWPKSFFCNGWLLVNNEKMSKSKGNFFTVDEIIKLYSADTVRLAMANSGDTLEPANFDQTVCNKAVLTLAVFLDLMKSMVSGSEPLDGGKEDGRFVDVWFANEMNRLVQEGKKFYESMYYREALRTCYFEFTSMFDQYRDICKAAGIAPNKALTLRTFTIDHGDHGIHAMTNVQAMRSG
eukprot:s1260_g1.t2